MPTFYRSLFCRWLLSFSLWTSLINSPVSHDFSGAPDKRQNNIMAAYQPGLFDAEKRSAQLSESRGLLVGLNARIEWEAFRSNLNRTNEKDRKK
jgi:hypothetical protein